MSDQQSEYQFRCTMMRRRATRYPHIICIHTLCRWLYGCALIREITGCAEGLSRDPHRCDTHRNGKMGRKTKLRPWLNTRTSRTHVFLLFSCYVPLVGKMSPFEIAFVIVRPSVSRATEMTLRIHHGDVLKISRGPGYPCVMYVERRGCFYCVDLTL